MKHQKQNNSFWKKGSSTIEAAYLIPFLVTVIMLFIYLAFFLYNRLVLTETAYIAAFRGSQATEYAKAGEVSKIATNCCENLLSGKLIAVDTCENGVEVKGKTVSVTLIFTERIPFERLTKPLTGRESFDYTVTKKAVGQNPYQFIRECRRFIK